MKKLIAVAVLATLAVPSAAMAQFTSSTGTTVSRATGSSTAGNGNVTVEGSTEGNASVATGGSSEGNSLFFSQSSPFAGFFTRSTTAAPMTTAPTTTAPTRVTTTTERAPASLSFFESLLATLRGMMC